MINHPSAPGSEPGAAVRRISAQDITANGPFVISESGHYLLSEDVQWTAGTADSCAITIAADGVVLDLGGHVLRQIDPPAPQRVQADAARPYQGEVVSGNVGIWAEGRRGLRIRQGSVADVQGVGIALKDCDDVELADLTVQGCGGDGVVDTSFLYRNGGIFVMGTRTEDGGIRAVSGIRLDRCVCVDNVSALDYVVTLGALLLFCEQVEVRDSTFSRTSNTSWQPSGVQFNVVGLDLVVCEDVLVEDCMADDNQSGGEPTGFFAWGRNYKFARCQARRNFTTMGNRVCGFNISDTDGLEMQDCEASGNYNGNPDAAADEIKDFSAAGYRIGRRVTRGSITNCIATENHSVGQYAPVAGFVLNSTDDIVLQDCSASGNCYIGEAPSEDAWAAGFLATVVMADDEGQPVGGSGNGFIDCVAEGLSAGHPTACETAESTAGFLLRHQRHGQLSACRSLNYGGRDIYLDSCEDMQIEADLPDGDIDHVET